MLSRSHSIIRPATCLHPCPEASPPCLAPHCLPAWLRNMGLPPTREAEAVGRRRGPGGAEQGGPAGPAPQRGWGAAGGGGVASGKHLVLLSSHLSFSTQLAGHLAHFLGLSGPQLTPLSCDSGGTEGLVHGSQPNQTSPSGVANILCPSFNILK